MSVVPLSAWEFGFIEKMFSGGVILKISHNWKLIGNVLYSIIEHSYGRTEYVF